MHKTSAALAIFTGGTSSMSNALFRVSSWSKLKSTVAKSSSRCDGCIVLFSEIFKYIIYYQYDEPILNGY